jgi:Na+-driven multidrug efflux pump
MAVAAIAACFTIGATAGLRALGQARRSLRAQLVSALLYIGVSSIGAITHGAQGAAWGWAAAAIVAAAVWWSQMLTGMRRIDSGTATAPAGLTAVRVTG